MKYLLIALLFATASLRAVVVNATVTFDQNNGTDTINVLEYVVEEKTTGGTWVEVSKAPASPITYSKDLKFGLYTVRVFVRGLWAGWVRDVATDTSAEFSVVVKPFAPTNGKIIVARPLSYKSYQEEKAKGYVRK